MGRKNKRINKTPDKSFDKFVKSFMNEKEHKYEDKKEQKTVQKKLIKTDQYRRYVERDKEQDKKRLEYAIQQLELNNIEYHIIDEETTMIECHKKGTNMWIKYYASSGFIMGFRDFRGIKTLIELLTIK